ncbi:FadR/GntR family transcriptional regulator, partial [Anaerosalibacter bizertensis]
IWAIHPTPKEVGFSPLAVKLAAERRTDEDIKEMHYLIEQQEQLLQDEEVDVKQFMKLDIEFHCVISRATNNEILKRLTLELVESYNRYILIAPFLDRANTIVSEHKRIIEAIKEEDGEKAAKIVQNHITDIRESLKERIEKIL